MNHIAYMEKVLDELWVSIFRKSIYETGHENIIKDHSDEALEYKRTWEERGIPFERASAIYMLTYSKFFKGPRKNLADWVEDRYSSIRPTLEIIERARKIKVY